MDETGLDMLLDIHGDEELPYNFINGNEVTFHMTADDIDISMHTLS